MPPSPPSPGNARHAEFGWPGGDRPGELFFEHEVAPPFASALTALIEPEIGPSAQVRSLTRHEGAIGRYAVTGRDGREWFIRVSARWGQPQLEQAITAFLQAAHLPVNHLVAAGLRLPWHDEPLRVDIRQRIRGRHFDGSMDDLRALAATLGACHTALKTFPQADRVRELAAARFIRLEETRAQMKAALARGNFAFFCQDPSWGRSHAVWLAELIEGFHARRDLHPASQCLHGQIHQANVLYAPGPILIDWEEAVQTVAPVQWDLAYFVQRFCLNDDPPRGVIRARLKAVRDAYGAPLGDLCGMMRHVAWLSAVILAGYYQAGIESPIAEYDKFVRLEEQARDLAPLLEEFAE